MAHLGSPKPAAFFGGALCALAMMSVSATSAGQGTAPLTVSQPLVIPEGQPKTERVAADAGATKSDKGPLPAFDFSIGARIFSRAFNYGAYPPVSSLPPDSSGGYTYTYAYTYTFSPPPITGAVSAAVQWYPGAHFTSGFASNIGLSGSLQYALVGNSSSFSYATVTTETVGGTAYTMARPIYSTKKTCASYVYEIGPTVRVPFSGNEVAFGVAYGAQASKLNLNVVFVQYYRPSSPPPVPDVEYRYLHPRASVRVGLSGRLAFTGGVGYLAVLSAGQIKDDGYFPRASVKGMDIDAGLSIAIAPYVQVRPSVDYRRFFYTFPAGTGAGVPDDQYFGFNLMLAYRE
jgi:hypothetical protein